MQNLVLPAIQYILQFVNFYGYFLTACWASLEMVFNVL